MSRCLPTGILFVVYLLAHNSMFACEYNPCSRIENVPFPSTSGASELVFPNLEILYVQSRKPTALACLDGRSW